MALKDWSTTAASNNSASPNGAPENMTPSGVNNTIRENMAQVRGQMENGLWFDWGHTPTRTGSTTFTIAEDVTTEYHAGRKVRLTDNSLTLYDTIVSSSYSAPDTTITVETGGLTVNLTAVELSMAAQDNDALPDKVVTKTATAIQTLISDLLLNKAAAQLTIRATDSGQADLYLQNLTTGSGSANGLRLYIDSSELAHLINYSAQDLTIGANNETYLTLDVSEGEVVASKNIIISKATPEVYVRATDSNTASLYFQNTTTTYGDSKGYRIGLDSSERCFIFNYHATELQLKCMAASETAFYNTNIRRWRIGANGGYYSENATGGNKGADTVNAKDYFIDGVSLKGYATSGTTASITGSGGTSEITITHGLGTDDVIVDIIIAASVDITKIRYWVRYFGDYYGYYDNSPAPTAPATGAIHVMFENNDSGAQTVSYKIAVRRLYL